MLDLHTYPPPGLSWHGILEQMPLPEREDFLASLGETEKDVVLTDWFFQARREQLPPKADAVPGGWDTWVMQAGRGAGKTRAGSEFIIDQHRNELVDCSALVGATARDVRRFMLQGESGILSVAPADFRPEFRQSDLELRWPNGTVSLIYTSKEPERLRGPNHGTAWCDELSAWDPYRRELTWDNLMLSLRVDSSQTFISTTPKRIRLLRDIVSNKRTVVTRSSTYANRENLTERFIRRIEENYRGTMLWRQEIEGELLEDVEGALWSYELLDRCRAEHAPEVFVRCGVGIDPAVSVSEDSSKTGIISGGVGEDGICYIVGDHTLRAKPSVWASKAIAVYETIGGGGDFIIAEKNNGGDLVEQNIRAVDPNVPVELVHASRGKYVRAEPISALYEQGKVKHVGDMPELEDQLCSMVPGEPKISPDNADALVWLVHKLMLEPKVKKGRAGTWGRKHHGKQGR